MEPTRRTRMSGVQRREQLLAVGREVIAEKGFDAASVEEIASRAGVSKPVLYQHFGGKEGLYAVVVDREVRAFTTAIRDSLAAGGHLREIVERTVYTLLTYIEESTDGFRILVRDSPTAFTASSFSSVMGEVAGEVEDLLAEAFAHRNFPTDVAPLYAQMLVGLYGLTGQYWLEDRTRSKDEVATHLVNLVWNGLRGLDPHPRLFTISPQGKQSR
ncbi:MAG: TetR/AcrR family transcriptional regulator [Buchananella hordeovulneris]|nr:TetR/AcrR family transcriptional regulator [Buchananella hordeovulneris]